MQISLFGGTEKFVIDKPIRLIELFAGYGSQHFALEYLGVEFESWKICEWAVKSIQAYKDAHFQSDNTDYSANYSDEFTFFVNGFEYNLFATVRNKECGEPDTLIIGTNDLKTACGYDEIFEKAYTKENYTEACRLAKKLFLGEKECL